MDDLLNKLVQLARCHYISDLPDSYKMNLRKKDILEIPEADYTIESWNEALCYFTQDEYHCTTIAEAKKELIRLLQSKP